LIKVLCQEKGYSGHFEHHLQPWLLCRLFIGFNTDGPVLENCILVCW